MVEFWLCGDYMPFFVGFVNEGLAKKNKPLMIYMEYYLLMATICWLHFYQCSPESFFDKANEKEYPMAKRMILPSRFSDIMSAIGGMMIGIDELS